MQLIIDRIEEGIAVCEKKDGTMVNIPLSELPAGSREGCVLQFDGTVYVFDAEEEAVLQKRIKEKAERLLVG